MRSTQAPVTWLFSPADNPRALASGRALEAEARIIDLEDGCSQADLPAARAAAAEALPRLAESQAAYLRIHRAGPEADKDIAEALTAQAAGVVLPKVSGPAEIAEIDAVLGRREAALGMRREFEIALLVETSIAVLTLPNLTAASTRISWLMLGDVDLRAETGVAEGSAAMTFARASIVLAAAAARLPQPVGPVWMNLADELGFQAHARRAREDGFGGLLCIHPSQLIHAHGAFAVRAGELAWAQEVLDAAHGSSKGATQVKGNVVDAPVIRRAADVVRRATSPSQHKSSDPPTSDRGS